MPVPAELTRATKAVKQPVAELSVEQRIWNHFVDKGYSRIHTAAIMGNLQQEHNYETSDVPGGLGIAQWLDGRRDRLINKGNYLDLQTQLDYIVEELDTTEIGAKEALLNSTTIEQATLAFQSLYERCNPNYCMPNQRIEYAINVLGRY